jgi:N-acetylmuramoyl-L-alanine amidase
MLILALAAACGPQVQRDGPPSTGVAPLPALPPIPFRDGPLTLALVYPPEGGQVTVRDVTFVFGSTGSGRATVALNGTVVPVAPNGAFLAFLPVPPDGVYRAEARLDGARAELVRRVMVPAPFPRPEPGQALIVEESVFPRGAWAALPGERIEVGFVGSAGGRATLGLPDGTRVPLAERSLVMEVPWGRRVFGTAPPGPPVPVPGLSRYEGVFIARLLRAADPALPRPEIAPLPALPPAPGVLELVVGDGTARVPLPLNLALLQLEALPVGVAFEPLPYPDSAGGVHGATGPGNTYHYFWANGTELQLSGQRAGEYRVRLAPDLHAWVAADRVRLRPAGTPPPGGRVGTVRLTPRPDAVDVRIALDHRLPYHVDSRGQTVEITLHGGAGDTRWLMSGGLDSHVTGARWSQPADGVYVLTLELAGPHWGHMAAWDANGDLVVRIRRPPVLDPRDPLRGLIVAVDPGHPPGGATGPTGLTEAEVNLAVGQRLAALLERAGARAVLTRTDARPVGLHERTQIAEAAGAHLYVSVHQNAFPDGVNPLTDSGTSTFYFHAHAGELARALQDELVAEFRLRDLGVGRSSLAVLRRLTWMPAALTETMFLMMPAEEAALRDPVVQERVAEAHLRGLARFLRERAGGR